MKNFELPMIEIVKFQAEDILLVSGIGGYEPGEGGVGGGMGM